MSLLDALLLEPAPFHIWIAARTDGIKGSGTLSDPHNGSPAGRFDEIMNLFQSQSNVTIHLGPGTFTTNGYADGVSGGWQARPGMKIIGSGIDTTTLQLVNATSDGKHYVAVGHALASGGAPNRVDACEVSDLTINCNLTGASNTALSAFGAVRLFGNHVRVVRVKAIHWGTKAAGNPCFAIAIITGDRTVGLAEVVNPGIEACIVVSPESNAANVGPNTAIHAGGTEGAASAAEAYGKSPYIRNCFVDCDSPAATAEYRGLSMGWCRGGVVEGNHVYNTKYGGPYQDKSSALDVIVRNNFYKNVAKGPYWKLGGLNPSSPTALASLVRDVSFDATGKTALATASAAHNLERGERIKIGASSGTPSDFKGIFAISDVPATNQFRYRMISDPGTTAPSSPTLQKVFGVGRIIVERNTVELATGTTGELAVHVDDAGVSDQAPDHVHGDVIIRDNKIRYTDGQFDAFAGSGIEVKGARNAMVSGNVVECAPANPLKNFHCGAVTYFNNRTPSGKLIQGYEGDLGIKYGELETDAEDAFVLAFLERR